MINHRLVTQVGIHGFIDLLAFGAIIAIKREGVPGGVIPPKRPVKYQPKVRGTATFNSGNRREPKRGGWGN